MTAPAPPDSPAGDQPERTALAWQRVTLGVVLGAVLLTFGAVRAEAELISLASCALAAWIAWSMLGPASARSLRTGRRSSTWPNLLRVAATVACLGILGLVLAGSRAVT
jgi:hypothetical protein